MLCAFCGLPLADQAVICPACGHSALSSPIISPKDRRTATLLCFFFGLFGAHRFYVGKTGTALLQLITLGGIGIWTIIDFFSLIRGHFTDEQGRLLN